MLKVQSVVMPKRKTKFFLQWKDFIKSELKVLRGYDKHNKIK